MSAAAAWPARTARFCWMAWYAPSGAVESDATGRRPDTQVVVALGGSQRQRARRHVEPRAGEEPRGDDRLGERQRDGVPPGRAHDDVRIAPGGAGAALSLRNERQREPVLLDGGPERVWPRACLGRLAELPRDALGEESRHHVAEDRARLVHRFIVPGSASPAPTVGGLPKVPGAFIVPGSASPAPTVGGLPKVPGAFIVPGSASPAPTVGGLPKVPGTSSESEPPRDDAAQDLTRPAAERERRRALDEVAERLLQVGAGRERRLDAGEHLDDLRELLLEGRADVFDDGGFEVRILARLEHSGDGERHLAERDEMRDQSSDDRGGTLARLLASLADQLDEEREARQVPLGPAPLEGELGRHLRPARALLAHAHLLGEEDVLEHDRVEVVRAGEVDDGADRDAGELGVHQELREPLVLPSRIGMGPEERDHEVAEVRVAGPHLGAVDEIPSGDALRPGPERGEVRAGVGLAHPDRECELTPRDGRQEPLALAFRAEAEEQRARLPVGHPVRRDGRPRSHHLLQHHVPLERRALVAAVALGPRHADPAARADLAAELAIEPAPGVRAPAGRAVAELGPEKVAHLLAEGPGLRGQLAEVEAKRRHDRLVVPLARAQLDEHPVRILGMNPGDLPAGSVVDPDALRLESLDAPLDVMTLEADEVDALAVLLEEAPDRLGRVRRLQELDVPDPGRQNRVLESELLGLAPVMHVEAEDFREPLDRDVEVPHDHRQLDDVTQHGAV